MGQARRTRSTRAPRPASAPARESALLRRAGRWYVPCFPRLVMFMPAGLDHAETQGPFGDAVPDAATPWTPPPEEKAAPALPIQRRATAAPDLDYASPYVDDDPAEVRSASERGIATPAVSTPHAAGVRPSLGAAHQAAPAPLAPPKSPPAETPIDPATYTVVKGDAYVREPAQHDKREKDDRGQDKRLPDGTRVQIYEEDKKTKTVRVKEVGGDGTSTWTWRDNLGNLAGKATDYKASNPKYVYFAAGRDLIVYLPPGGLQKGAKVDVMLFFHGDRGDYAKEDEIDNRARGGDIASHLRGDQIAICPQAKTKASPEWADLAAGSYGHLVEQVLHNLTNDLGFQSKPLQPGAVGLAGHSHGGAAVGQAAQDLGATDVTLQDAGYSYYQESWNKLQEWLCLGKPAPKMLRVISKDASGGTHTVVEQGNQFYKDAIVEFGKKHGVKLTTKEVAGDGDVREGEMVALGGLDVIKDGDEKNPQGKIRVFHVAVTARNDQHAHWKVSDQSMAATMDAAGRTSETFGAVQQPGAYLVLDGEALVREEKAGDLVPVKGKKKFKQGSTVQVSQFRVVKGVAYAFVDGEGWTSLDNLQRVK